MIRIRLGAAPHTSNPAAALRSELHEAALGLGVGGAYRPSERVGGMLAERVEQSRRVEGAVMGATEDVPAAATTDAAHAKMLASLGQLVEQVRNGLQSPMQPMISQRIS